MNWKQLQHWRVILNVFGCKIKIRDSIKWNFKKQDWNWMKIKKPMTKLEKATNLEDYFEKKPSFLN